MAAILIIGIFLVIMLIGTPVGFAMGALTYTVFYMLDGNLALIPHKLFSAIDSYTYVCLLLYILATDIMSVGGITSAIVRFCTSVVGHVRGGLAHVNVLGSMMFAGLSGSALADVSGLGPLEIQMMEEGGYKREYAATVTAASSIIGPIIPPSNVMIIFAGAVGTVSVGKMFLAGIVPGIMLGIAFMCLCYYNALRDNVPCGKRASIKEIATAFRETLPALLLPVIILGSIASGVCTATESSALAVTYAILVSTLSRRLTFKSFVRCCIRSAKATANVLFIIAVAGAMGWAITTLQIAQTMTTFCVEYINNKIVFLIFVNVVLLILGMFLDSAPAILLIVPILWPVADQIYNMDVIHFGLVVCLNLMIGMLTPPVGMVLFVTANVAKLKLSVLYRRIWPFVGAALIVLLIVTYIPAISTFIPNLFMP